MTRFSKILANLLNLVTLGEDEDIGFEVDDVNHLFALLSLERSTKFRLKFSEKKFIPVVEGLKKYGEILYGYL